MRQGIAALQETFKTLRQRIDPENALLCLAAVFVLLCLGCFFRTGQGGGAEEVATTLVRSQAASGDQMVEAADEVEAPGILPGEKIDLNTAGEGDLTRLPGIGAARAAEIAAWRERNGGFQTKEQIQEVYGIGSGIYRRIEAYITVTPPPIQP